jgi:oligopeptide/dipeptide ABC transporter ATP-binding protein
MAERERAGVTEAAALLVVRDLTVTYPRGGRRSPFTALDGVSLTVGRGETMSVVGESGSGKTTLGSAILGLQPVASGSITLAGRDISHLGRKQRRTLRTSLQAVFQDPFGSLDPSMTVGEAVAEPLRVAKRGTSGQEMARQARSMLERVGMEAAAMQRFPGEFSGGQRQRIAIARALILDPEIVVCDEAVSALDVSVQAQVLNLLESLQQENGTSYLFISHNMAVVQHISDRVLVLYRGRMMESGSVKDVCGRPAHPYTRSLLSSVPIPDVTVQRERRRVRSQASVDSRNPVNGAIQTNSEDGVGCPFAPRCPFVQEKCVVATPPTIDIGGGRQVACVRIDEIPAPDQLSGLIRPQTQVRNENHNEDE